MFFFILQTIIGASALLGSDFDACKYHVKDLQRPSIKLNSIPKTPVKLQDAASVNGYSALTGHFSKVGTWLNIRTFDDGFMVIFGRNMGKTQLFTRVAHFPQHASGVNDQPDHYFDVVLEPGNISPVQCFRNVNSQLTDWNFYKADFLKEVKV